MPYPWIDDYLLQKPGVTKDLQPDWNWIRYQIGSKLFAAVCLDDQDQPYYITLKLDPAEGDFLRGQYEDTPVITGLSLREASRRFSVSVGGTVASSARFAAAISSFFRIKRAYRSSLMSPVRRPSSVSRRSALSCRRSRRYSARLVIIRYGSFVPFVDKSSASTPI